MCVCVCVYIYIYIKFVVKSDCIRKRKYTLGYQIAMLIGIAPSEFIISQKKKS